MKRVRALVKKLVKKLLGKKQPNQFSTPKKVARRK